MSVETSVTRSLNETVVRHDALADPVAWYATASAKLFAVALLIMLVLPQTRKAAIVAAMATPIALGLAAALAALVTRARPFASTDTVHRLIAHAADNGFPSDHATASFAIATAIFISRRKLGAGLLVAAAALGVSRVAAGVHWPTDILAGAACGVVAALLAAWAWRRLAPRVEPRLDRLSARLPVALR